MAEPIRFKLVHADNTHRFCSTQREAALLSAVRAHVAKCIKKQEFELFWNDEESDVVLDTVGDLNTAIDFARVTRRRPSSTPCIHLVVCLPSTTSSPPSTPAEIDKPSLASVQPSNYLDSVLQMLDEKPKEEKEAPTLKQVEDRLAKLHLGNAAAEISPEELRLAKEAPTAPLPQQQQPIKKTTPTPTVLEQLQAAAAKHPLVYGPPKSIDASPAMAQLQAEGVKQPQKKPVLPAEEWLDVAEASAKRCVERRVDFTPEVLVHKFPACRKAHRKTVCTRDFAPFTECRALRADGYEVKGCAPALLQPVPVKKAAADSVVEQLRRAAAKHPVTKQEEQKTEQQLEKQRQMTEYAVGLLEQPLEQRQRDDVRRVPTRQQRLQLAYPRELRAAKSTEQLQLMGHGVKVPEAKKDRTTHEQYWAKTVEEALAKKKASEVPVVTATAPAPNQGRAFTRGTFAELQALRREQEAEAQLQKEEQKEEVEQSGKILEQSEEMHPMAEDAFTRSLEQYAKSMAQLQQLMEGGVNDVAKVNVEDWTKQAPQYWAQLQKTAELPYSAPPIKEVNKEVIKEVNKEVSMTKAEERLRAIDDLMDLLESEQPYLVGAQRVPMFSPEQLLRQLEQLPAPPKHKLQQADPAKTVEEIERLLMGTVEKQIEEKLAAREAQLNAREAAVEAREKALEGLMVAFEKKMEQKWADVDKKVGEIEKRTDDNELKAHNLGNRLFDCEILEDKNTSGRALIEERLAVVEKMLMDVAKFETDKKMLKMMNGMKKEEEKKEVAARLSAIETRIEMIEKEEEVNEEFNEQEEQKEEVETEEDDYSDIEIMERSEDDDIEII